MTLPPPPPSSGSGPAAGRAPTACYRHPDRVGGRNCTRCGRPACADCLVSASVGSHCLDCAKAARPSATTRVKWAAASQPTLVATALIALNVVIFIVTFISDRSGGALYDLGGDSYRRFGLAEIAVADGEWYRLITSGFLHFGIIHIGFNMYMLYLLSQALERVLGHVRFGLLYVASLLTGSLGVIVLENDTIPPVGITAGASGAVFGLLGAALIGEWMQGVNPLRSSLGQVVLFNVVFTFVVPNISIGGHLGGLAGGFVCGWVMLAPRYKQVPPWATYAMPAAVGVAALAAGILLAQPLG